MFEYLGTILVDIDPDQYLQVWCLSIQTLNKPLHFHSSRSFY